MATVAPQDNPISRYGVPVDVGEVRGLARSIASRKITVKVVGDALHESDETISLRLSNAKRARIADGVGRGTILDDDTVGG